MISATIANKLNNVRGKPDIRLHSNTGKLVYRSWGGTPDETQIIDVDEIELTTNTRACQGYILQFPEGQTPHSGYPFGLHDIRTLPWDYSVRNGVMTLYARGCSGYDVDPVARCCKECKRLDKNPSLEGIRTRLKDGVHENAQYAYHGTAGYQQLLRRKDAQNEFYRLRGLNQAKKLLGKATALSDYKRFVVAIASGKVERVDRVLQRGLKKKKGISALLASLDAAAQGLYRPRTYTEKEDMRALLIWRLGGTRVAHINHRSQDAPSVSYLRSRSIVPPVIASPRKPTVEEVNKNVEATIKGLDEVLAGLGPVIHVVMMFDEIATEKRIRWDPKTNCFIGVCREHAHKTSMEFINPSDMEELFRCIDDGVVHYAAEVRPDL
jgi:hypothetical protein